jgi:AcrR family transcriptional regulator
MPRISDAERARRRARLVDAAWNCLAGRAYSDLTVDEICSAAGVSKGAFYGYFRRKHDLLLALIAGEAARLDAVVAELERADLRAGERLRRFAQAALRDAQEPARVQLRSDLWAAARNDAEVAEPLRDSARSRRRALRGWIERGVAAGELRADQANALASIVIALVDGLTLHASLDANAFRWQAVDAAVDSLLSGLDAGAGPPRAGTGAG